MLVVILVGVFVVVGSPFQGRVSGTRNSAASSNLKALVAAQRASRKEEKSAETKANLALAAAAETELGKKKSTTTSRLTLEKRLRYARSPITAIQYRAIQILVTIAFFIPAYMHGTVFIVFLAVFLPQAMVSSVLDHFVAVRFKAFDDDYPVLLMSYVSLLKTGMNTIQGLEAASKGLDQGSLVRSEIELMIERLRLGLTEEQAISAFGEDIHHPELELFVQSLLLSRRVGGMLSQTLERLAKQVRKRQEFRKKAVAAVGMERSSIYAIAFIMSLLLGYLIWSSPELVLPAFSHELGNKIFQAGIMLIVFGFYWSRKVTNIRI